MYAWLDEIVNKANVILGLSPIWVGLGATIKPIRARIMRAFEYLQSEPYNEPAFSAYIRKGAREFMMLLFLMVGMFWAGMAAHILWPAGFYFFTKPVEITLEATLHAAHFGAFLKFMYRTFFE